MVFLKFGFKGFLIFVMMTSTKKFMNVNSNKIQKKCPPFSINKISTFSTSTVIFIREN